jgi:hypothetical protein
MGEQEAMKAGSSGHCFFSNFYYVSLKNIKVSLLGRCSMNYKILMGMVLPCMLYSMCMASSQSNLSVQTPPLDPKKVAESDELTDMPLSERATAVSPFHGFSPWNVRERAASDGSEQTVLAGLAKRSPFGSAGSLHEHPFSPCKRSVGSFCSLSEHPVTPTK